MIKKIVGITLLVGVIGVLTFGAINRSLAASENRARGSESAAGAGQYGQRHGGSEAGQPEAGAVQGSILSVLPGSELTAAEENALIFMREEEKLARDVYLFLYEKWGLPLFQNIAASEASHMETVAGLLTRYEIADPAAASAGVFSDPELQALYAQLTDQGSQSLGEALKVGAAVEEIDILDLQEALAGVEHADVQQVFNNLLSGSYNHLRAFTSTLSRQTGETYQPQYLSLEAYQTIVDGSSAGSGVQVQGNGQRGQRGGRGF